MTDAEKDLVEIIEGEADELGLPKDPSLSLFGQPLKLLPGKPDPVDIATFILFPLTFSVMPVIDTPVFIREYMETELRLKREKPELSIKELRDGPLYAQFREPASNLFYTIAPDPPVLVVITGKSRGGVQWKIQNYVFAVDVYVNDANVLRGIARYLDSRYQGGIVDYTNWAQVQKVFGVSPKECIDTWWRLIGSAREG